MRVCDTKASLFKVIRSREWPTLVSLFRGSCSQECTRVAKEVGEGPAAQGQTGGGDLAADAPQMKFDQMARIGLFPQARPTDNSLPKLHFKLLGFRPV